MKKHFRRGSYWIFIYPKTMSFVFSYPYSEEHHEARSYLRARCPAWCDRILLSHSFKNHVNTEVRKEKIFFINSSIISLQTNQPIYDIIGYNVCVGDHKVRNLLIIFHNKILLL